MVMSFVEILPTPAQTPRKIIIRHFPKPAMWQIKNRLTSSSLVNFL
jgi:hypothetical protein